MTTAEAMMISVVLPQSNDENITRNGNANNNNHSKIQMLSLKHDILNTK